MRINGLLAAVWQALRPGKLVESDRKSVVALIAFSSSTIGGSMMVFITSATGIPSKVGCSLRAFLNLVDLISSQVLVTSLSKRQRRPPYGRCRGNSESTWKSQNRRD